MEEKELLREEEANKIAKDLKEKYELDKVAEMVKDNKISFTFKDKEYQVRLLNQKEKDELDLFRRRKYGELLQDKNILFEKQIIKLCKEKGIDIETEIDDKSNKIMIEINNKRMKLGESLEKNETDSILKTYRDEIDELLNEIYGLTVQKSILLENSFEKTLENYVIKVLSWLSLEKKVDEDFVRAFDKIEDFLKADEELIGKSITYSMSLNY